MSGTIGEWILEKKSAYNLILTWQVKKNELLEDNKGTFCTQRMNEFCLEINPLPLLFSWVQFLEPKSQIGWSGCSSLCYSSFTQTPTVHLSLLSVTDIIFSSQSGNSYLLCFVHQIYRALMDDGAKYFNMQNQRNNTQSKTRRE